MPPELLVLGVPLLVLTAAMVQGLKGLGLATRYAGLASIVCTALVLGLLGLEAHTRYGGIATWLLASLVYGLAASGLYSQAKRLAEIARRGRGRF